MYLLKLHLAKDNKPLTVNADNIIFYGWDATTNHTILFTNALRNNHIEVLETFKDIDSIFYLGEEE